MTKTEETKAETLVGADFTGTVCYLTNGIRVAKIELSRDGSNVIFHGIAGNRLVVPRNDNVTI